MPERLSEHEELVWRAWRLGRNDERGQISRGLDEIMPLVASDEALESVMESEESRLSRLLAVERAALARLRR